MSADSPQARTYHALLFDIGGVLVPLHIERAYRQMAAACAMAPEEIPARLFSTRVLDRYERGQLGDQEFFTEVRTLLGARVGYEEFCRIWCSLFDVETLIPAGFLAALAGRYRLVLLSNTNPIHVARLRAGCAAIPHFHDAVFSHEVGSMKPETAIFEEAIRRAGCPPSECFYVDDGAPHVEAARRLGIDAVRFEGFEALKAEMRARGIL